MTDLTERWLYHELSEGREVSLPLKGGSMRPWLPSNTPLTLSPCAPHEARLGGVYVFWRPERPEGERLSAAHRAWWVGERLIWLKGDSLPRFDEPQPREALLARVSWPTHRAEGALLSQLIGTGALWPLALLSSALYSALYPLVCALRACSISKRR